MLEEEEAKEQQEQESSEEIEVAGELLEEEEVKEQQEQEPSEEAVETSELLEEEEAKEQQEQESSEEAEAVEISELLEEEEAKEEQQGQETSKVVEAAEEKGPLENPQSVKVEGRERKRFVPYNVMMLKQDRLRLEQKKQEMPLYTLPPIHLLHVPSRLEVNDDEWLQEQMELLNTTFFNF
ncbi:hypothetical protein GCM10020331_031180 [Ectobacillus funiculus]